MRIKTLLAAAVFLLALALAAAANAQGGARLLLLTPNSAVWVADDAALCAGGAPVPQPVVEGGTGQAWCQYGDRAELFILAVGEAGTPRRVTWNGLTLAAPAAPPPGPAAGETLFLPYLAR